LSWNRTENVKVVLVVPDAGVTDPLVRDVVWPLNVHETAATGATSGAVRLAATVKTTGATLVAIHGRTDVRAKGMRTSRSSRRRREARARRPSRE
jgi:hypothetical protein